MQIHVTLRTHLSCRQLPQPAARAKARQEPALDEAGEEPRSDEFHGTDGRDEDGDELAAIASPDVGQELVADDRRLLWAGLHDRHRPPEAAAPRLGDAG